MHEKVKARFLDGPRAGEVQWLKELPAVIRFPGTKKLSDGKVDRYTTIYYYDQLSKAYVYGGRE